jgi:hypothetical protein
MKKKIQENVWPHGTKAVYVEEVSDAIVQKFIRNVALAAKTSGLLDVAEPKEIVRLIKTMMASPTDLMRELKKMGQSAGRATATFRQVRKDL